MQPVPVNQFPGNSDPEPDWDAYFDQSVRIVRRMIRSMDDTLLRESWRRDLDLFFIHRRFGRLDRNARKAHELLREMVEAPQVPSLGDIQALTEGRAISLLNVCRLRYCLEVARKARNDTVLFYFNVDRASANESERHLPVTAGKVIPSINVFDKERYAEVKAALGIAQGELTAFAGRVVQRSLNIDFFEGELERGSPSETTGERTGYYRLTDFMAGVIYSFLTSKAEPLHYPLQPQNFYLPRDPTYGPGRGKWCRSMLRNRGNYWPA